jgi:tol-pal system protein YbgF
MRREENRPTAKRVTLLLGCLLILLLAVGCGSSKQATMKDDVDINELLGDDDISARSQAEDEAEVLRLLGITPAAEKSSDIGMVAASRQESSGLETDVQDLKGELLEKDREINELRSRLTEKEVEIGSLESQLTSPETTSLQRPGPKLGFSEFQSSYKQGLSQFNARRYQDALDTFSGLLKSDAMNSLSDNCQYWIGECYYGMRNYEQAIASFEKVFSFPNSNKSDDAQLKLGLCYLQMGDKIQAKYEFDRLLSSYPDSEYRAKAQRHVAKL